MQIMRNEEFDKLDNLKEEGLELARKGKLYTKLIVEASELLKKEAVKIFSELAEN